MSLDELLAAKPDDVSEEMATQLYNSLDKDKSGGLSATELAAMANQTASSGISAV